MCYNSGCFAIDCINMVDTIKPKELNKLLCLKAKEATLV